MKASLLALALAALAPISSFADSRLECSVLARLNEPNEPNVFGKELISVRPVAGAGAHYFLFNESQTAVEEMPREVYEQRKNEKRFQDIHGRVMAAVKVGKLGYLTLTVGTADATQNRIANGVDVIGVPGEESVSLIPHEAEWSLACQILPTK